ncbi:MAG: ABC transporter permease [Clostridiaceae bacterium]|nr:ABC transporter permease [Clostridiaceae bacterium]
MTSKTANWEFSEELFEEYKKKSQIAEVWRRLKKSKTAMLGLFVLTTIILLALFADLIRNYQSMAIEQNIMNRLQSPNSTHWFGTDAQGRDLFARVIHGARISLLLGFSCTAISVFVGLILGSVAGYFGGKIDGVIMRILDSIMSIPAILLSLAIVAVLGQSIPNLIIAMTVAYVPGFARIVRASVLTVIGNEYIEAAKASGLGTFRIISKYVLPNAFGPIIVEITMSVASVIKAVAGLSFIGLGIIPPTPEWGAMLSESREFMRYNPYLVLYPGLAIVLTSLSLNLLGDGLRDALDPRLKD